MKYAICMPVYNEADGIETWILELLSHPLAEICELIIVDDASTDETNFILSRLQRNFPFELERNENNLGHGPTMKLAVEFAIRQNYDVIVTCDGDGQLKADSLFDFVRSLVGTNTKYAEGVRINRVDPWYRRTITSLIKALVLLYTGQYAPDANTPVRFYSRAMAEKLWGDIPSDFIVPNLLISIRARRLFSEVKVISIESRSRLGVSKIGSSWNAPTQKSQFLPPKRLIKFCIKALKGVLGNNR